MCENATIIVVAKTEGIAMPEKVKSELLQLTFPIATDVSKFTLPGKFDYENTVLVERNEVLQVLRKESKIIARSYFVQSTLNYVAFPKDCVEFV
jgi:hypothetical protein